VDALDRQLHMMIEDIGDALCYHCFGSGRAVLPSQAFRPFTGPIEPGLPELVHEPPIGATISTCLVGLRRSLASSRKILMQWAPVEQLATIVKRCCESSRHRSPRSITGGELKLLDARER